MLWCQLDLWFTLKRRDVGELVPLILNTVAERFHLSPEQSHVPPEQQQLLITALLQFLGDSDERAALEKRYQEAVDSLSVTEPLLAYKLSGKASKVPVDEKLDVYLTTLATQIGPPQTEADQKLFDILGPFLHSEGLSAATTSIESDIEAVATLIGRGTRREVRATLGRLRTRLEKEKEAEIKEAIDRYYKLVEDHLAATQQTMLDLYTDRAESMPGNSPVVEERSE
jgi:hypothetical protein